MKKFEKQILPQREVIREVSKTCDICLHEHTEGCYDGDWSKNELDVNEVSIRHWEAFFSTGKKDTKGITYDICPTCWKEIVKPFLDSKCKNVVEYKDIK